MSQSPAIPAVAYLADGKLYLKEPDRSARLVESTFAQSLVDRATRSQQRNAWKSKGMGWSFGTSRGMPNDETPADVRRIRFSGVTRGEGRQLLYALDTDHVGGLFAFDPADNLERRLFHRNDFRAQDLSRSSKDGMLAFSLAGQDGTANIALLGAEGRGLREVTEGDSVDEAPSWSADGQAIVFQSAGVGRNAGGMRVALGPYAIQRMDTVTGDLVTLAESDDTDYLVPRLLPDGTLWYIRRPFERRDRPLSPLKVGLDVLLFPFRLARAVVHFLNFFSLMFARKPLLTAGGPPKEGPDARYMMLWGKLIDAEKALRESKRTGGRALVPKTWELVRRSVDEKENVVARGVVCFDACPDGSVVYTDGGAVYHVDPAGNSTTVCEGKVIERVSLAE